MILPPPHSPFQWVNRVQGPALVCLALEEIAPHLMTTRPWRLGARSANDSADTWADVAEAMQVARAALSRVHQVHGRTVAVRRYDERIDDRGQPDADIIISNDPATVVAIQSADCVPLLIADQRTGNVAAAHAGWRGLAAKVPAATVEALAAEFGSRPEHLVAAVGPSIGPCCYGVGVDVLDHFRAMGASKAAVARWFRDRPRPTAFNPSMPGLPQSSRAGHWYFDPWMATRDALETAGIPSQHIHVAMLCTASHADLFCSYRRDGQQAGRMAAAIRCALLCP